jgi:hypothetical protein
VVVGVACASRADKSASAESWSPAHVDSLLEFGRKDQSDRDNMGQAMATNDTGVIFPMMRADSARSHWLRAAVKSRGWPTRSVVGDSAAAAAWLILQHSPLWDWQEEMLPTLEQLGSRGELRPSEIALLTDRVLGHRGQPQRYGSQFSSVDGKLVPAPIADLPGLEARRAAVGLPPMAEYVRVLGEIYKLPVVWPPPK